MDGGSIPPGSTKTGAQNSDSGLPRALLLISRTRAAPASGALNAAAISKCDRRLPVRTSNGTLHRPLRPPLSWLDDPVLA